MFFAFNISNLCAKVRRNSQTAIVTYRLVSGLFIQADIDVLGGQFRPVTEATQKQLNIKYGLEVLKVNSGALRNAGINRGFIIQKINDQTVNSIDALQKIVKSASTSSDPVLYIQGIYPTGKKAYFAVPLSE